MPTQNLLILPTPRAPATPDAILDFSLKRIRRKNGLSRIANQWANAMQVSMRVVSFLTDRVPDANGDPLLLRSLREAIDGSQNFVRAHPGVALHPQMFSLFLTGILSPCVEVLRYRVACPRTNQAWDPLAEDLYPFLQRHPLAVVRPNGELSPDAVAEFFASLAERIVLDQDLANIDRSRDSIVRELVEMNQCLFHCA